jgi:hypothetical protein
VRAYVLVPAVVLAAAATLVLVAATAVDLLLPSAWHWLTATEDLGARLRRECATVAREMQRPPAPVYMDLEMREQFIKECIAARARGGR